MGFADSARRRKSVLCYCEGLATTRFLVLGLENLTVHSDIKRLLSKTTSLINKTKLEGTFQD